MFAKLWRRLRGKESAPTYTIASLAEEMASFLPYRVLVEDDRVTLFDDGKMIAYVCLDPTDTEAVVFFERQCTPEDAADIALDLNETLTTYCGGMFSATRLELAAGVH